ncbi:hypothetical protein [Marinibactrum halimedae]|uniref:Uncharacterized protein n=1 Tax=Marinibactrum halimedae TaxID=1444977 RepID=A0AA37TBG8_9GAMM|nr:hypothetical protein [Marinibactrum halimedae]MCD9459797.1 hypothetical protein [Marinibactrum halimedae]GLS27010.1 hypothetical protein GCM10007877_27290 [Marinibactrum halimedae]
MNKLFNTLLLGVVAALSGCLEVEDNNNDDVTVTYEEITVTARGRVVDAYDEREVSSASITVKRGDTVLIDSYEAENGRFELPELPAGADLEFIISSTNGEFMQRVFYSELNGYLGSDNYEDIGLLKVSQPITVDFSVVNEETQEVISNLEFYAHSHAELQEGRYYRYNGASSYQDYAHRSTFNSERGVYEITLPQHIDTNVLLDLDVDGDGLEDYHSARFGVTTVDGVLTIAEANTDWLGTLELEVGVRGAIEFRISVLDEQLQPIPTAIFYNDDSVALSESRYDEALGQHIVEALVRPEGADLRMPAFTYNDVNYQSATIDIFGSGRDRVNVQFGNVNNLDSYVGFDIRPVIDLVVMPKIADQSSSVNLLHAGVNSEGALQAFYSEPITIEASEVALFENGSSRIVRDGSGSTQILRRGGAVPVDVSMDLNGTRLTVIPAQPLLDQVAYQYSVGDFTVNAEGDQMISVDLSVDDSIRFSAGENGSVGEFNPAMIKADNRNYRTNNVEIITENSAGFGSFGGRGAGEVYLYFPPSIVGLQTLYIRVVSVTRNGVVEAEDSRLRSIITSGNSPSADLRHVVVSVSDNENVNVYSSNEILLGTAFEEGLSYYEVNLYGSFYLQDNESSNVNSVTIEYSYQTRNGDTTTGEMTLPVQ